MPVRSSSSSVFRWPDAETVGKAAREFAERESARHGLLRLGYFGSYARGDHGVGSDLDFVAVVASSDTPFFERGSDWDLALLPVPAEIPVFTSAEWEKLMASGSRFATALRRETVWLRGDRG